MSIEIVEDLKDDGLFFKKKMLPTDTILVSVVPGFSVGCLHENVC